MKQGEKGGKVKITLHSIIITALLISSAVLIASCDHNNDPSVDPKGACVFQVQCPKPFPNYHLYSISEMIVNALPVVFYVKELLHR